VALNALQATPRGGRVRATVARDGAAPGRVRIDVIDEGEGIADTIARRVFEPFFTTKAKGTGLGLAVVKRIVDEHRGEIAIAPATPCGTRVTIRLPLGA